MGKIFENILKAIVFLYELSVHILVGILKMASLILFPILIGLTRILSSFYQRQPVLLQWIIALPIDILLLGVDVILTSVRLVIICLTCCHISNKDVSSFMKGTQVPYCAISKLPGITQLNALQDGCLNIFSKILKSLEWCINACHKRLKSIKGLNSPVYAFLLAIIFFPVIVLSNFIINMSTYVANACSPQSQVSNHQQSSFNSKKYRRMDVNKDNNIAVNKAKKLGQPEDQDISLGNPSKY